MLGKMYNNGIINSGKNVRRYNPVTQFENLKDTMLIRDRVYDALRREILSGGFAPGETLNILGLSKQMGVSCAPVREALNMLNKDGLVDLMPYKKASVAMGTDADYKAAFDLRLMLEPYALLQSIDMIPGSEIRAMELHRSCKPGNSYDACLVADFDSLEALSRYKNDPRHVAVSQLCKSIRESRGAIDYEL